MCIFTGNNRTITVLLGIWGSGVIIRKEVFEDVMYFHVDDTNIKISFYGAREEVVLPIESEEGCRCVQM